MPLGIPTLPARAKPRERDASTGGEYVLGFVFTGCCTLAT